RHGIAPAPLRAIAEEMGARACFDEAVICHGDLHAENARFAAEPTLFNFEAWGLGPPAYDVACFWRKHVHERAHTEEIWAAFLGGYRAMHLLSDLSVREVPAWAVLRAIWVMGLPAAEGAR